MRLQQLELQNFRNFDQRVFRFTEGRTLIQGPNGLGKSTIFDAVAYALLGRCRGVDGKGQGRKDLIRLGAADMRVSALIDPLGMVSRSIGKNGSTSSTMDTGMVTGRLQTSEAMLTAVLYGGHFFDMHHADAKTLLLRLLNVTVSRDQLPGVDLPNGVNEVDLPYLATLYQSAYDARAVDKRALAAVHVADAPNVIDIDLGGRTPDEVKALIRSEQAKVQTLSGTIASIEQAITDQRRLLADVESAGTQIATLRGTVEAHEKMRADQQTRKREAETARTSAETLPAEPVGELQTQVREASILISKIEQQTQDLVQGRKKKAKSPEEPHVCVLGAGIPCLTPAKEFTGAIVTLKDQLTRLDARIKAGTERTQQLAAADQSIREADRQVGYHDGQIASATAKIKAKEDLLASGDTIRAELPALDQNLATSRADRDAIGARVGDLIERLHRQVEYETQLQNHRQSLAKQADLRVAVDRAEALCDLLGPNGISAKLLQGAVADFEEAMNAALERFGFRIGFTVEPWKVEINSGDGWLRYELLSDGQKIWTSVAFQLALAKVSGLDFCVIDRAEAVVGEHRAILTDLIMDAPVGQVLIAMAKADGDELPDLEGLQVIALTADLVTG